MVKVFNSRMRDEFLNGELFGNVYEAQVLTNRWVTYYNEVRPYSSLNGRPPAPQTIIPALILGDTHTQKMNFFWLIGV
jgi:putative transposase